MNPVDPNDGAANTVVGILWFVICVCVGLGFLFAMSMDMWADTHMQRRESAVGPAIWATVALVAGPGLNAITTQKEVWWALTGVGVVVGVSAIFIAL